MNDQDHTNRGSIGKVFSAKQVASDLDKIASLERNLPEQLKPALQVLDQQEAQSRKAAEQLMALSRPYEINAASRDIMAKLFSEKLELNPPGFSKSISSAEILNGAKKQVDEKHAERMETFNGRLIQTRLNNLIRLTNASQRQGPVQIAKESGKGGHER